MVESSGQLGGKDDVRQVQGPRLDTSSPDRLPGVESAGSAVPGSGASPGESAAWTWLVQRRLPDPQGANGCWCDYPPVEASSAAEAMQKIADAEADHMLHTEFRVQPMPEFERFWPESETTYTRRVRV